MRRGPGRRLALLLTVALAVTGVRCGGGGSTPTQPPGPPPPPPPPPTGVFFSVQGGMAGPNTLSLDADPTTPFGGPFRVELTANDVADLFGVSFDLEYPNDLLRFREEETEEGGFLSEGGAVSTTLLIKKRPSGNLIVGLSRLGSDNGGVDGSGTLLILDFAVRPEVEGMGELAFMSGTAFASDGQLPDARFRGGTVEVRR